MELHQLSPALGSRESKKRKGRGQGSGKGGTSTKGHKGAQSRSGYKTRPYFEGGQNPVQRRHPKMYFKRHDKDAPALIKTSALVKAAEATKKTDLNKELLIEYGLVKRNKPYKILSDGPVKTKVTVEAFACSAAAQKDIEAEGGKVTLIQK